MLQTKNTVTVLVTDGAGGAAIFYLPVVTHIKMLEYDWFTDSGFGLTILAVLAMLE